MIDLICLGREIQSAHPIAICPYPGKGVTNGQRVVLSQLKIEARAEVGDIGWSGRSELELRRGVVRIDGVARNDRSSCLQTGLASLTEAQFPRCARDDRGWGLAGGPFKPGFGVRVLSGGLRGKLCCVFYPGRARIGRFASIAVDSGCRGVHRFRWTGKQKIFPTDGIHTVAPYCLLVAWSGQDQGTVSRVTAAKLQ